MTESNVRAIRLTIAYDGSCWHGWQVQENAPTVQQTLSEALLRITGETVVPHGAGRTDAGVHARGQVALFHTQSRMPAERFREALNSLLPRSIAILDATEAEEGFHPQRSAVAKHYQYLVHNRRVRDPFSIGRVWHVPTPLSLELLQEGACAFPGEHDFRAFCSSGHSVKTYERTIYSAEWSRTGDTLVFDTVGSGFLYNMVRIMVGTMVDAALGATRGDAAIQRSGTRVLRPEDLPGLIASGDRSRAGRTAPPDGLYMMQVFYEQKACWIRMEDNE